ncbi:MAG: hypothetical protein EB127_05155 [Alphaproteobacteria bacterium]|nr:hypothetical protein [Alphaproteobacteria bacterium]
MPNTKPNNKKNVPVPVFVSPLPPPGQATSNTEKFGTYSSPKGGTRKRRSHKKKTRRFRR